MITVRILQVMRTMVPSHLDVIDELSFPPGLGAFLANNLSWLLRPSELAAKTMPSALAKRKRGKPRVGANSSDEERAGRSRKQFRGGMSTDDDSDGDVDSAFYFLPM